MMMHTYGNADAPKILALHPMLASGEAMGTLAGTLSKDYCILAPDLSGHGGDAVEFVSAQKDAAALCGYLKQAGITQLELVYGASLGGAVGMLLLADPQINCRRALFDGAPLYENAAILRKLLTAAFLKKHRKAVAHPEIAAAKMTKLYGEFFGPSMGATFERMSEASVRNIIRDCSTCSFPRYPAELEQHLYFEYGSKDGNLREARRALAKHYPAAGLTVREGFGHCGYMAAKGAAYEEVLRDYLNR